VRCQRRRPRKLARSAAHALAATRRAVRHPLSWAGLGPREPTRPPADCERGVAVTWSGFCSVSSIRVSADPAPKKRCRARPGAGRGHRPEL